MASDIHAFELARACVAAAGGEAGSAVGQPAAPRGPTFLRSRPRCGLRGRQDGERIRLERVSAGADAGEVLDRRAQPACNDAMRLHSLDR